MQSKADFPDTNNANARARYGNPQTWPFFVMGAEAGDTPVIHLIELKLNRDYADSLDDIVGRAQSSAVQYSVANLAGRSVGMAAKLDKTLLPRR